ncbi:hypothetical protein V2J09_016355, partial [Rumex salicifolius]
ISKIFPSLRLAFFFSVILLIVYFSLLEIDHLIIQSPVVSSEARKFLLRDKDELFIGDERRLCVVRKMETVEGTVAEVMRIHRSLPPRPAMEEVEAAKMLIQNVEKEDQMRLEAIAKQPRGTSVPEELFFVLKEMQKSLVLYQSKEQKREASNLLDLEHLHSVFDDLIQKASQCVPSQSGVPSSSSSFFSDNSSSISSTITSSSTASGSSSLILDSASYQLEKEPIKSRQMFSKDDSYVKKSKVGFHVNGIGASVATAPQILDSSLKPISNSAEGGEKLSLIKLASLIQVCLKKDTKDLNLQNKLMDQIEWLPDSIGKLSGLITLDLSENRITTLPATIGGLSSLMRLDLHSNRITELPEPIGNLLNLVFLDLRANQISSLPPCVGRLVRLEELDVSSNSLSSLPDTIGSLVSLKILNVETNDIDELPHTIGQCSLLEELRAEYNRLKALPEAVGKLESLKILSVRYNNIRQLPTTMSSLSKLRELDVSFNELEQVPESLCFATSLVKLNIGNNFADLRFLPRSIGNLEMLQELDMSNNQIRALPESFRFLTQLRVLRAEENPLEVPPRHISDKGAQAVVQYMADLVTNKDIKTQPIKQKKCWLQRCFLMRSKKRKQNDVKEEIQPDLACHMEGSAGTILFFPNHVSFQNSHVIVTVENCNRIQLYVLWSN